VQPERRLVTGPLVSCIMPTRDRRRLVGQSVAYFLRQDYPERELLILDDGRDPVADLVPDDPRLRYVRLDQRLRLGAKRNLACELTRGTLIAHWDDDDWMASDRLSRQVSALAGSDADACGLRELLHYRIDAGEAWLYRHRPNGRPWLAGCTLLYRREAWAARPFAELETGEDSAFVAGLRPERVLALDDSSFYLSLLHRENTAARNLADSHWERRPLEEATSRMGQDRSFYVCLRNGSSPATVRALREGVTMAAEFNSWTGYGSMAVYTALGMTRVGARVELEPLALDLRGLPPAFGKLHRGARPQPDGPTLYYSWVRPAFERFRGRPELFVHTMWESDTLPRGWSERLNAARAVLVPSRFVAGVCRSSGVTVPIEVVPDGVDADVYSFEERPERESLTTLIVAPVDDRKNVREGIAAWKQAFAGDTAARLIVKTTYGFGNYEPDDPRIRYVDEVEPAPGIAHWYREADVLLALGNEGFGLPLLEGMATGLPVIVLASEGQGDICREAPDCLLAVDPAHAVHYAPPAYGPAGLRGVPGVDDVALRLRWVDDHRDDARELGRRASAWALEHRDVWAKGPAVLDAIESYGASQRRFRRARILWVPSLGTSCGIAEYTRALAAELPGTALATAPDPTNAGLLHVQHEPALFDAGGLARELARARRAGVPVAVTEHAVGGAARSWEAETDALVVHTPRGAELLRARWPGKRVELISHGCPTWFPPRKRRRGRTVAGFGFLEPHKGFTTVLDVLRELRGTELVLYSHARSSEFEGEWEQAAAGLPVRRVAGYLAEEEVARRLAAEADLLVFWYDEASFAAASGAARVGLATGVPVLTSPTSWFADLTEATFQPETLVEGVRRGLDDDMLRRRLTEAARAYCHDNSWARVAERHLALWHELERT
jgi:glycosyltransferase involved in cell wall biosynthesis